MAAPTSPDPRKLYLALPAALVFVGAGLQWIAQRPWIPVPRPGWSAPLVVVCAVLAFGLEKFQIYHSPNSGFSTVAERMIARPDFQDAVFLVSSNGLGEGIFIAEMASREPRPTHIILRASKYVSQSTWHGDNYRLSYETPAEMMKALRDVPVRILVLHTVAARKAVPHHQILHRMVEQYSQDWVELFSHPVEASGDPPPEQITVYELQHKPAPASHRIQVDLRDKLGKVLTLDF